ncbi:carboxypeptidase M32 [Vallitalea okinawensis]|uniref:carboxypeptidase M32 n=1 Tax=Vallitalea okinawensis TaxID=2078660 RepID=UPI001FA8DC26|nr:carboxypeptidase M32 [Vallitalea okinawensis]
MSLEKKITAFRERMDYINTLSNAVALMHWDGATGAPKNGINYRSKNIGILSSEIFQKSVLDTEMKNLVYELYDQKEELDEVILANVKDYKESIEKLEKIPAAEYRAFSELKVKAEHVWEEALEKSDFKIFEPYLKELVDYTKKFIDYREYTGHPYNALLDDYEKGITVDDLDAFFGQLKDTIVPLVKRIQSEGRKIDASFITKKFSIEGQEEFSNYLLGLIKFDLDSGMLKESTHPFTMGIDVKDVRITTRYYENLLTSSLFSTLHEGGHGIYEQNIDEKYAGTPVCDGTSMGIHESQSRFYENILGRSLSFWEFTYPKLKEIYPEELKDISLEDYYLAINEAKPSLIRVEADELTYALHVMVRYEIEKGLIDGSIEVKNLPEIWNDKYEEYLGIRPCNDAEGVLQDVHWSDALFGYFPSYALGNAYSCQFTHEMSKSLDIDALLKEGNFEPINDWLRENIHQYGKTLTPKEIVKNVTGEELNAQYLIDYLTDKFNSIYFS